MKKLLLLLAVVAAFTCTSVAQYGSSTSDEKSGTAKEATLTGCISAQADAGGNYTLTNGKYKKGVQVSPADKVKDHAGHQAQLTGQWSADKKTFEVANLKHISATCEMAAGGGTTGTTKKGKDKSAAPPKS
jgi:hypothetical protein